MPGKSPIKRQKKSHVVSYRITYTQYYRLVYNAAASDQSVNEWARLSALSSGQRVSIRLISQCDPALLKQIHHIGQNLNQLVKNAHIFKRVSPQVEPLCFQIKQILERHLKVDL